MKKIITVLISAALILCLFSSCALIRRGGSGSGEKEETGAALVSVSIEKETSAYAVGDAVDLKDVTAVKYYDDGSESGVIGYYDFAENGLAVYVYHNGEHYTESTYTDAGTYIIGVCSTEDGKVFAITEVTVTESGDVYPTAVSLKSEESMTVGDTMKLKVSYEPSTTTVKNISWQSSDENVATVDEDGNITAVGEGVCEITVKAASESGTVSALSIITVSKAAGSDVSAPDQTGDFSITTEDGSFTISGRVYTITSAGEYFLKGKLDGQIVVAAAKEDAVIINLCGVTISYDLNSPISAAQADSVTINLLSGTENTIYDKRSAKVADVDELGEGALSAKCDISIASDGLEPELIEETERILTGASIKKAPDCGENVVAKDILTLIY